MLGAINFLVIGPMYVGIPVIAKTRMAEGAAAYGIVMSSFGGGSFIGIILAGFLPKLKPKRFGTAMMSIVFVLGLGLGFVAYIYTLIVAIPVGIVLGAAYGYLLISLLSWLQGNIPPELMGRMMSLVMFASVGLAPVSQALAGVVLEIDVNMLFIGAGGMLALLAVFALTMKDIRSVGVDSKRFFEI